MRRLMLQVERVAASEGAHCILGENRHGEKELMRALCTARARARGGPFVTLNCAAVARRIDRVASSSAMKKAPSPAPRAPTANSSRPHHGTAPSSDEMRPNAPRSCRPSWLRVLEEGEIERVGGEKPVAVNARVIVATHRNLEELVDKGSFRRDLYHRIFVFPIMIPPLRDRFEDVPPLADHFARMIADQNGWKPKEFSPEALEKLGRYSWPGNVRELRNVVERLLLLAGDRVDAESVASALPNSGETASAGHLGTGTLNERVEAFERDVLLSVCDSTVTKWRKRRARWPGTKPPL